MTSLAPSAPGATPGSLPAGGNATAPPSPFGNIPPEWATQDRGIQITAIFWAEAGVALLFIAARLYSRHMIRSFGLDDGMMLLSVLAFIALSGIVTNIAQEGGFRHLAFVPLENATDIALKSLISQAVTVFAYGCSKFAVGYLLIRLLPPGYRWHRWFLWTLISATLFYNWLQIILTFVQCHPYQGAWDFSVPSSCWTETERLADIYTGGIYNVLVDITLALFPVLIIWNLQLNAKKKVSLLVLLGLGLLAAICAIIKLTYVPSLFSNDQTWSTYDLDVWSGTELFVVIVCGSIPPSKPLWDRVFPNSRWTASRSRMYHSEKTGGGSGSPVRGDYEMVAGRSRPGSMGAGTDRILAKTEITVQQTG